MTAAPRDRPVRVRAARPRKLRTEDWNGPEAARKPMGGGFPRAFSPAPRSCRRGWRNGRVVLGRRGDPAGSHGPPGKAGEGASAAPLTVAVTHAKRPCDPFIRIGDPGHP